MLRQQVSLLAIVFLLAAPALSDIEDFSRYPAYERVTISPGGKYLAVTHKKSDREILSILKLPLLDVVYSRQFGPYLSLTNVIWATDERLLLQPAQRYPAQLDYDVPTGEIFAIDADGGDPEILFGYRAGSQLLATKARRKKSEMAGARVIDRLPGDPEHVVIETLGYGIEGTRNEALLLNIHDGRTRRLARSPIRNASFVTDGEHQVRLLAGANDAGDYEVYLRQKPGGPFQLAFTSTLKEGSLEPISGSPRSGYYLFADSRTHPMRGLVEWNPVTDDRRELFRHSQVDFTNFYMGPDRRVWTVRYVDHFPEYSYPDPEHPFVILHRQLRASFPDDDVRIFNQTDDMRLAMAYVTGPRNPGTYHLLDTVAQSRLQSLETRPWLKVDRLVEMEPIEVTVRDGTRIRGYLTLPLGKDRGLPLVVLVHGGPHGISDSWGFNPEVQMLAEYGYAVLQVNFRGSGGRGREFLNSGYGKWGVEMQDDVTDSVRYVVSEGIADPDRICIYGASYGAYSALVGAYRDPDLYRCTVGYAGIYDLPLMFEKGDTQEVQRGVNFLKTAIGTDEEEMRARSPVFNAGAIKAAVMLIHGKKDQRAPFEHARRMRRALIDAGNPPVWLVENREAHGFADEDNRLAMYTALLEFLDENLKPDS